MRPAAPALAGDLLRPVDAELAPQVRRLFEEVFGHPLSAAEWQWKYGEGRGQALALERDGELLAHFGGLSRRVVHEGREVLACQVCDVAVAARARNSLRRQGPLHGLTSAFLNAQIGWERPHLLGFGFPTDRAFGVAERLGFYAEVDQMWAVAWPARALGFWDGLVCEPLDAAQLQDRATEIKCLWNAMRAALPGCTLGVRNADWLRHRYLAHPRFQYELCAVRRPWRSALLGLAVWRRHAEHLEWVDLIAPPQAWPQLLRAGQAAAAAAGLARLEVWTTRSQLHRFMALQPQAAQSRSLAIQVPANVHSPGPTLDSQRNRWFLMAGDTDFR